MKIMVEVEATEPNYPVANAIVAIKNAMKKLERTITAIDEENGIYPDRLEHEEDYSKIVLTFVA